jgi:hypothetical protein
VTTPNLKMASNGKASAEFIFSTPAGNLFGNDFQDDLSANYRIPFSVAVGAEIKPWSPLTLGISVEYSTALGRQALLNVQGGRPFFRGPTVPEPNFSAPFLTPLDERRTVANVSVGAEYAFSDTYAAYLGFWTDFSPLDNKQTREVILNNQGVILPTGDVDIYHVVFGATRTTQRSKIAAGAVVSHGTGTSQSGLDITPTGDILGSTPGGGLISRHVSFFSISLLLGYTYFF